MDRSPHSPQSSFRIILYVAAALALAFTLYALVTADYSTLGRGLVQAASGNASCVGVITLTGEIATEPTSWSASAAQPYELDSQLRKAAGDSSVGAVLLEINSPGGGAVASKEAYDVVRASKKPVVAYLGEVAASGGYYVASGTDYIIANPNTLTGSIGGKIELLNYGDLMGKLGVRVDSIQSGESKDVGSPYRNLTDAEKTELQAIINESAANFVSDVRQGRGARLNNALFNEYLDARVLSAKMAKQAGLVDAVAGRREALRIAAAMGNVTYDSKDGGVPDECYFEEHSGLDYFLSRLTAGFARQLATALSQRSTARLSYS